MSANDDIIKSIRKIVGPLMPNALIQARVTEVNDHLCNVEPLNEDAEILDVKIMSSNNGSLLYVPKVDSIVYVAPLDKDNYIIVMYDEVDEVLYKIDKEFKVESDTVDLDSKDIKLSGTQYGGLIKIDALISDISALKAVVDALIVVYNAHTHIITTPAAPNGPALPTATVMTVPSVKASLENSNVKHG